MNSALAYKNKIPSPGKGISVFPAGKTGMIFILCICIFSCNRKDLWKNEYLRTTLPDVTMTSATGDDQKIIANWIDPVVPYMNRIEITCSGVAGTITLLPGVQTYTITGLTNGIEYSVNIKVRDSYNNSSPGAKFSIKPSAIPVEGHFIYEEYELDAVRGGIITGWDISDTYNLMEDLDLTDYGSWDPIGNHSPADFTGVFEGNNHSISNLTISGGADYRGLFGYITNTGNVSNLILTKVNITGGNYVGGLVGENFGTISNCHVTGAGAIDGMSNIGGLIGNNNGNVSGASSFVNVTATAAGVGGLIGVNQSAAGISGCSASGTVTGAFDNVGGLIGSNSGGAALTNCTASGKVEGSGTRTGGLIGYNTGDVTDCHAIGVSVRGTGDCLGGLVGAQDIAGNINYSDAKCDVEGHTNPVSAVGGLVGGFFPITAINNCHATGNVKGNGDVIGGLVGDNFANISSSYATGDVSSSPLASDIGGFLGYNEGNITGTVSNPCYATGNVTGTGSRIGGFIGRSGSGTLDYCRHITGSVSGADDTGGLVGETSSSIINCLTSGSVSGTGANTGGLVGNNSGTITNSHSTCTVNGTSNTGGLVGYNTGIVGNFGSGCSFTGDVTGSGDNTGGLVGDNNANGNISYCSTGGTVEGTGMRVGGLVGHNSQATSSISYSSTSCTVTGYSSNIGGLVGICSYTGVSYSNATGNVYALGGSCASVGGLAGYTQGTITQCFATGIVDGNSNAAVGGLIGRFWSGSIDNSYARGDVYGALNVGGLVGEINTGTIDNCYATGLIDTTGSSFGGFAGDTAIVPTDCYYDMYTSGYYLAPGLFIPSGTPATTNNMTIDVLNNPTNNLFYNAGWDFTTTPIWSINGSTNNGYPYLYANPPQ